MPTFKKVCLPTGVHHTRQGAAVVTPERIRHWHDSYQRMKARGIKVPISWGHHPEAKPSDTDSLAEKQFWTSKFNAGYVTDSSIDPKTGALVLTGDAPAVEQVEDGNLVYDADIPNIGKVKCAIGEVSIGVDDWTDGQKENWPDSLNHLALVTKPVWHGQSGFMPANTLAASLQRFSLANFGDSPMADDTKPDEKPEGDKPPEKKPDSKPPEKKEAGPLDVKKLLKCLEGFDPPIKLPEDTDEKNLVERLYIAVEAITAARVEPEEPDMPTEPDVPVREEPQVGAMMSLISSNPLVASLIEEREAEKRGARLKKLDALVKRGLKPTRAKVLRDEISAVRFSLGSDNKPAAAPVDATLALLEETLPSEWDTLRTFATEPDAPESSVETQEQKNVRVADEMAKNARLPKRKVS